MLYKKSAVKNKKPVTEKQNELAKATNLFNLDDEVITFYKDYIIKKQGSDFRNILRVGDHLQKKINYDYRHSFKGIRTADEVWNDRRGHCIEISILFYNIVNKLGYSTRWLIAKNPNPKEYKVGNTLDNHCVHAMLLPKHRGEKVVDRSGSHPMGFGFFLDKQKLSQREFIAFCYQDAGEDEALNHKDYETAFKWFDLASKIDPNNYTIDASVADAYFNMGDYIESEKHYRKAIRKAPEIADTYVTYAKFLVLTEEYDKARKNCIEAAKKPTSDLQILRSLEKMLYHLGERSIYNAIRTKRQNIQKYPVRRQYFARS